MNNTKTDFALVEGALEWAYRQGYVDGEAAGEAFARITGLTMSIRDLGQYGDTIEFHGERRVVVVAPKDTAE